MWPSMGVLSPGTGPISIIPEGEESHHWHHGRAFHVGSRHHARAKWTLETWGKQDHSPCRRRRSREWSRRYLSLRKCGHRLVNQSLDLLFHPSLVGVSHVLFVSPATTLCFSHTRRITVATTELRHVALKAVDYQLLHCQEK